MNHIADNMLIRLRVTPKAIIISQFAFIIGTSNLV